MFISNVYYYCVCGMLMILWKWMGMVTVVTTLQGIHYVTDQQ